MAPRKFSYFPAPFVFLVPLLAPVLMVTVVLSGRLTNPAGALALTLYVLFGAGTIFWLLFVTAYFKRPWRYWVDDHMFTADRLWGRDRFEIPWLKIARVKKADRADRFRNWPEVAVEAEDGTVITVPANLRHYTDLIEIIRQRAQNCREFEVHPGWRLGQGAATDLSNG